ncbi:TetR family transcriptional regulator [Dyella nitratireducens]|uniref:TetR family transcriptional regulator n=2 Tax=Dyella nitratireducens TaxID=1849580 RepID=A0ABQ1GIH9_9GAMM|nr:TetR family transcriptional regulator [Dyella nitratireducens]GLQ41755.1 TetR family transcriptional regulator [Dyella nitratireducens]
MEDSSVFQGLPMDKPEKAAKTTRKPRADAERNRRRLAEVAKAAFAEQGADVSLEEIARRADVGIGTLYRHFPTRNAILEAIYRQEAEQLGAAATELLEKKTPVEALRAWMRLFVEYIATKKLILPALKASTGDTSELTAYSSAHIRGAADVLVRRAIENGDIRKDVQMEDLLYALFGFANIDNQPDLVPRAHRLIDILVAGLMK